MLQPVVSAGSGLGSLYSLKIEVTQRQREAGRVIQAEGAAGALGLGRATGTPSPIERKGARALVALLHSPASRF
jgi:hypothetical protein